MDDVAVASSSKRIGSDGDTKDVFLLPPPSKRRLTKEPDGRLIVKVSPGTGKTFTPSTNIDLESCSLSERERMEFKLLSKCDDEAESMGTGSLDVSLSSLPPNAPAYEVGIDMADRLEAAYSFYRQDVLNGEKLSTPLSALDKMAKEFDVMLHFEYHEIRSANEPVRILAEVFVGNRKGYGEASTKKLACHMACAHLLLKLEATGKHAIPPYYMMPGCRINPRIFADLSSLCDLLDVERPMFVLQPRDAEDKAGALFTVKCQIGTMITIGESDSLHLARRWAAKFAFEGLTGFLVSFDFVCCGQACMSLIHAKIQPTSSTKKLLHEKRQAADLYQQKSGPKPQADDDSTGSTAVGGSGNVDEDTPFNEVNDVNEDLGGAFAENDEHLVEHAPEEDTNERMQYVIDSMTEDVKEKLKSLRIGGQKQANGKKQEGGGFADDGKGAGAENGAQKSGEKKDQPGNGTKNKNIWNDAEDWEWGD